MCADYDDFVGKCILLRTFEKNNFQKPDFVNRPILRRVPTSFDSGKTNKAERHYAVLLVSQLIMKICGAA